MIKLSDMAVGIQPSPIRKMFNIASSMDNIISFTLGEPDFTTPQHIIDAECRALNEGKTHYTANAGIYELREAISNKLKKLNNVEYNPEDQIVATAGGMEALLLTMMVTINPGDEVIITDPYWSNYPSQIKMCGGIPVFVKVFEEDGFIFNPDNLRKAIGKNTKAILLNSPANPTGGVASRDVLEKIAEIAKEHDLFVISDEVYRYFVYEDAEFSSISSIEGMKERTIVIDSFSKSYAMTGWRVGFAAGPSEVIQNMTKLHENVAACVHTPAQYAAVEALTGTQTPLDYMVSKYSQRRELIVNGINSIMGLSCIKPKGAFYVFMNITKTGLTSDDFAMELLKSEGVVVVPGTGFGESGEGFVRLSYATSDENIKEGLKRMKRFVQNKCTLVE